MPASHNTLIDGIVGKRSIDSTFVGKCLFDMKTEKQLEQRDEYQ